MKVALCPGSFDPITLGHVDIVERGLKIFDRIIVAVSQNPDDTLFSPDERLQMVQETFRDRAEIEIMGFEGLLAQFAKAQGIKVLLRGLRTVSDFEFENQMANANRFMVADLDTLFMVTEGKYSHVSSSLIREKLSFKGDISGMVPPQVETQIRSKMKR